MPADFTLQFMPSRVLPLGAFWLHFILLLTRVLSQHAPGSGFLPPVRKHRPNYLKTESQAREKLLNHNKCECCSVICRADSCYLHAVSPYEVRSQFHRRTELSLAAPFDFRVIFKNILR